MFSHQNPPAPAERQSSSSSVHTPNNVGSWAEKFDSLGASCAKVYLEFVHFELPVLEPARLLRAWRGGRAPFPPDSLLHHALVAVTAPWLTQVLLEHQTGCTRDELVEYHIEEFKKSLSITSTQASLEQTQALLLATSAVSGIAKFATRGVASQWLSLVMSYLRETRRPPSRSRHASQSRIRRRIWWSTYVLERSNHLRYTFEDRILPLPPQYELHASDGEPLSLEDFELDISPTLQGFPSDYWTKMQGAALFMQKKTLLEYMAEISVKHPWPTIRPSEESTPRPPAEGHLRHDEYSWRVQGLLDQFERLSENSLVSNLANFEVDESALGVAHSQLNLQLTLGRVLIVLCQPFSHGPRLNKDSPKVWKDLRRIVLLKTLRRILALVRDTVGHVSTGSLTPAFSLGLLRPLIACSNALLGISRSQGVEDFEIQQLKGQCRRLLETCLRFGDPLQADDIKVPEATNTIQNLPDLSSAASTRTETWTPSSLSLAPTPADDKTEVVLKEPMTAEQELLSSFDDMWNKHLVTGIRPSFLFTADGDLEIVQGHQ